MKIQILYFPEQGKQEDTNSCKTHFIGLCHSKLFRLAKWIRYKDIIGNKVTSEHIRIYNMYKYITAFVSIAHAHAHTFCIC